MQHYAITPVKICGIRERDPWLWDDNLMAYVPDESDAAEYAAGYAEPNYPVPAVRKCPWCHSAHIGHYHFISEDDGIIVPAEPILD